MQALALPLSFALSVVLIVAVTQASPPLTGVLYLTAILAGISGACFLRGESGHGDEVARRSGGKRPWYEEVEHPQNPESEDAYEPTSS